MLPETLDNGIQGLKQKFLNLDIVYQAPPWVLIT
jgi:hypothetical protein